MNTARTPLEVEPIARVLPMLSVPHLDREFDYLVSAEQSDDAQPGVRVRVRFHGRLVDGFVLERRTAARPDARTPSQIVIVLEESLGSDFVGALGGRNDATPELERHFGDGLLLTNLVANGNRTVRGLEGVLCSFVPLPGYAILRRDKSENVATVARVLSARGAASPRRCVRSSVRDRADTAAAHRPRTVAAADRRTPSGNTCAPCRRRSRP